MFQDFEQSTRPEQGPPRLAALRGELAAAGLDGVLVPRADAHQGEYVAPRDDRLAWLTGFTGSAGFCCALLDRAGVFVDGRYTVQARAQLDTTAFTPVDWPATGLADWLRGALPQGGRIGFDPWLHTPAEMERLEQALNGSGIVPVPGDNLLDRIWTDQPAAPQGRIIAHPLEFAGEAHEAKARRLGAELASAGETAAVLTLPDSIAWLLNIRGSDIARNPVPHAFALLHADGAVTLYVDPAKLDEALRSHLGASVTVRTPDAFVRDLQTQPGPVRAHRASVPCAVADLLGDRVSWGPDPVALPKARKNPAEIAGSREAHLRDAAAMCRFLAWYDAADQTALTEIDLATTLEGERRATNALREISFDTIAGAGPNGALPHYRVTHQTNRQLTEGALIVLDSGGQYPDGTTDITRTLVVGEAGTEEKACFTRVLKGMIAVSRLRFPRGVAGAHLDAIARYPLWLAGLDYDHGTGHGVGAYLSVHEGPQRLSRAGDVPLEPGMILSNEPGYYREGAFGIRIENLIVVQDACPLPGGDDRDMLEFETLTFVPIDRRLIDLDLLEAGERDWIDRYHAACRDKIAPRLDGAARLWLEGATRAL
ncbi:aminopeptidase P family protein [Pseudooceanicola aestuarii]|uniref:aminopeptidase P family protein n=1 Tax=Pseudooceanicola aestuarii TaxID=2697319 RepID=UPI0013D1F1A5|nr:aminopeptidase P family protein [Pseudooceanicola aestuarii]